MPPKVSMCAVSQLPKDEPTDVDDTSAPVYQIQGDELCLLIKLFLL